MAEVSLSESEKTFIIHGIQADFRADGRTCLDYRTFILETDVVSNCSGSAHVRLANTDVLVGIKAELTEADAKNPNQGRLEFFVDCSANATPEFEGKGGDDIALDISSMLSHSYDSCNALDLASLCVIPGQQVWTLFVDIVILECAGSLMDAVSVAVKAALFNTRIPLVTVKTDEDGTQEVEVSDDPFDVRTLDVSKVPCIVTFSRVGEQFIVDASQDEEMCILGTLIMSVTPDGAVTSMRKSRSGSLHPESILDVLETAQKLGIKLNNILMPKLKEEATVKKDKQTFLM